MDWKVVGRSRCFHKGSCPADNERTWPKDFEILRQGEEDDCIASWAGWNAQLKGLVELERRYQNMMQEVKLLSERQEVLKGMVGEKIRLLSRATAKYYEQMYEEMKELEGKKLCSWRRISTFDEISE